MYSTVGSLASPRSGLRRGASISTINSCDVTMDILGWFSLHFFLTESCSAKDMFMDAETEMEIERKNCVNT